MQSALQIHLSALLRWHRVCFKRKAAPGTSGYPERLILTWSPMKIFPLFFAGSSLALGAFLILASPNHAAEKNSNLSPVDEQFIQEEAIAAKAVAKIADEAAARSESAKIRAFARVLVRDHEKFSAEFAKLARSRAVELGSGDLTKHEAHFEQLREEKGAAFDSGFLEMMVRMHKDMVENFEKTATDSPDAELKNWAAEKLAGLKSHLEKAKELSPSKTVRAELPHLIVL